MSILKSKHNGWLADGTRTPFMGGGGGGPSTTKSETTNIPDYARPYVENMMGATQKQLFITRPRGSSGVSRGTGDASTQMNYTGTDGAPGSRIVGGGGAGTDQTEDTSGPEEIVGFKPYQAYSSNVNDYFAGPSPLMQQSYQAASQLRTPEQIAAGSKLAEQGGLGLLGTAPAASTYGGLGAAYGMGAGQAYENQATSAADVARYMSPYMQNVVDYQKSQALRDYQMAQPVMQAKAAGQGAFGGNRLALQQAEAQRGLMSQLQGIEAQGAQSAFDKAQAAQQYRANLGLQGAQFGTQAGLQGVGAQQAAYQGATQAGSALGNLGQQQIGSQMGIIGLQNQLGLQQQQLEQQKINQAISDYATAQQYPLMQLGFMSNMLRGLPMQATTTQSYQAQPGIGQQALGYGLGALGAYKAFS